MERDERNMQERPSVNAKEEANSPPRGGGGGCDRLKRDEWSEGAVASLLEAYESKWVLRNRAKLKGQDWEDVATHVSSRADSTKSPKTQTQCKNKIESMKKRYRSESAVVGGGEHASSWPLFSRLDHLMRRALAPPPPVGPTKSAPLLLLESLPPAPQPPPPCFLTLETAQNPPNSNGADQIHKEERVVGDEEAKASDDNKGASAETDSSTPALYGSKDTAGSKRNNNNNKDDDRKRMTKKTGGKRKRRRVSCGGREDMDVEVGIAQSLQLLAEAVVRSERARMETLREVERMRAEAEASRAQMDLKRTQIIATTQLQIARIFAACSSSAPNNIPWDLA